MTFTVLQHLRPPEALGVVAELKRISRRFVLLVEETDATLVDGDPAAKGTGITVGREVAAYVEWMRPWTLTLSFPRRIEPGYPRADVGTYMLFRASA